ncbi:MAG: cupredoxin domain-containing protein [Acidimicrobiales bacterium]
MRKLTLVLMTGLVLMACGGDSEDEAANDDIPAPAASTPTSQGAAPMDAVAGGNEHADHGGQPTSSCSPAGTALILTASGTKFDKNCLAAPAGQAFTINYDNRDDDTHNIAILESHMATEVLYRAEIFQGPKVERLSVGALKAGNYAFHCEVHPDKMSGTFIVQ